MTPRRSPLVEAFLRQWRRVRRYELKRTLHHTEKRLTYVKRSLASIDRAEGRVEGVSQIKSQD